MELLRGILAAGVALTGLVAATACTATAGRPAGSPTGDSLVFAVNGDPGSLDPAYAADGLSWITLEQMYDTLVSPKPGSTEIGPRLALSWKPSGDGRSWTFDLRRDVKFQDGTAFDGKAVCANFDRWHNFSGLQQSPSVSTWWQNVFGGFKKNESDKLSTSLYKSCSAPDDHTAVIELTRPSASFMSALSMTPFSIASPAALEKYDADAIGGNAEQPDFNSPFGTQHPVGTGPYTFVSWEHGDRLTLKANPSYWGGKPKIEKVVLRVLKDPTAKLQELQAGGIDGFSSVPASMLGQLRGDSKVKLYESKPFDIGHVSFNSSIKPFDDPKIRQAVAHAINRPALRQAKLPPGTEDATQFIPSSLDGYADDATSYAYDPAKAKQLIKESGVANPTIEFWYPTGISRPYMPNPQDIFQSIQADLQAAGFTVQPKAKQWSEYVSGLLAGKAPMFMFGLIGTYPDSSYFLNLYTQQITMGDFKGELKKLLAKADETVDPAARAARYQDINRKMMEFVPGVPYGNVPSYAVFSSRVRGFTPSPLDHYDFSTVELAS
ncbi:ABC transporter substrate-binding protein [Nonomuraea sp. NPDC050153]|uniref:ABC transporter substrate-binding protein n=1 Tax=Nonomuraea sp. NPDC050153 TaxID=3364359 RepID=UPI0037B3E7AF